MSERAGRAALLLAVTLLLLCCLLPRPVRHMMQGSGQGTRPPAPPAMPSGTVDVNEADAEDLQILYGVGETLSEAVIAERENRGPFWFPEDLLAVRGIGSKTLMRFWDELDFSGE